jgi:hypothetical protein
MLTRRIVTSVCALCLGIPAAAAASPPTDPVADGPYGITSATGPPTTAKAKGPYGVPTTGPAITAKAKGPYGVIPAGPPVTANAKGPYGVTPAGGLSTTAGRTAQPAAAPRGNSTDWRIVAICEAALLALAALGLAHLVTARRHAPRMAA